MEEMNYFSQNELKDELKIDLKKILFTLWARKILMLKVGIVIFLLIVLSTFTSTKKYVIDADLYINKSNNSNMVEFNPYVINEMGDISLSSISDKVMMNEMELMQSPLVIDKVIKENDLRYKKLYGIFTTVKTGEYLSTDKFLKKKKLKIENKKGTNIVSISYKSKDKDEAYGIVSSLITNYIELHKELNSEKSKSDKKIIESEYQKAKEDLNKKVSVASGLPTQTLTGTGNLAAMSAFSRSAQNAISTLRGQYLAGEKARVDINEDASKVNQLAQKLEWARLVEEMSDSSKVLVIKEPRQLKDWECTSPKLFTNILLGIILGAISSLIALIFAEKTDKKLTYSMLGDNIIYNLDKEFQSLSIEVISNADNKTAFVFFEEMSKYTFEKFKDFVNVVPLKADISNSFKDALKHTNSVVTFASIGKTSSEEYKLVKKMITNLGKNIIYEVLV